MSKSLSHQFFFTFYFIQIRFTRRYNMSQSLNFTRILLNLKLKQLNLSVQINLIGNLVD